jgi:hypothetical protein
MRLSRALPNQKIVQSTRLLYFISVPKDIEESAINPCFKQFFMEKI